MGSKLYICANHIGNIEDLPSRTIQLLKEADLILCEDTRTLGLMMSQLKIQNKLISYYDHNEKERAKYLRQRLQEEEIKVVLISEAGMPLISDPGYHVVNLFHELELEIEVIPGPSAVLSALALSGFSANKFTFIGFWPKKFKEQKEALLLADQAMPIVFFESPFRVLKTIECLKKNASDLSVFVVKELTKRYQRYWRGSPEEVLSKMQGVSLKGEFTLVIFKGKL